MHKKLPAQMSMWERARRASAAAASSSGRPADQTMGAPKDVVHNWKRLGGRALYILYLAEQEQTVSVMKKAANEFMQEETPNPTRTGREKNDPERGVREWVSEAEITIPEKLLSRSTGRGITEAVESCSHGQWLPRRNQYASWFTCQRCGTRYSRKPTESWNGQ